MDQAYESISTLFNSLGKLVKTDNDDDGRETSAQKTPRGPNIAPVEIPFSEVCAAVVTPSPSAVIVDSNHFRSMSHAEEGIESTDEEGAAVDTDDLQSVAATETDIAGLQFATDDHLVDDHNWRSGAEIVKPNNNKSLRDKKSTVSTSSSSSLEDSDDYEASTDNRSTESDLKKTLSWTDRWAHCVESIHRPIKRVLLFLTHYAAVYPVACILLTIIFSLMIITIGYYTKFDVEDDQNLLWKPMGSLAEQDGIWIDKVWDNELEKIINVSATVRRFLAEEEKHNSTKKNAAEASVYLVGLLIHNQEENVVSLEGASRLFQAHDHVLGTPNYVEFCAAHGDMPLCPSEEYTGLCNLALIPTGEDAPLTCSAYGPTAFFLHNSRFFHASAQSDEQVQEAMAKDVLPGETSRFQIKNIIGYPEFNQFNSSLISGKSFTMAYIIPAESGGMDLTRDIVNRLLDLQETWDSESNNTFRLVAFSTLSFGDEFSRGIVKDIPLVPVAFVVMSIFTCLVFYKHNSIYSRSVLGFGAVACVLLSIMTGYGLLFCIGVKFTSLTQLLPFIMFGIGLDDGFVLITSHGRQDMKKDPVERVRDTIEDVGVSIFMTTLTTVLAFSLGCTTTIPSIRWLCMYAAPTVAIDFLYQITFFISLMVLDDRRILAKRRDCCVCLKAKTHAEDEQNVHSDVPPKIHIAEQSMMWYSEKLLRPWTKVFVIAMFTALFGLCIYKSTMIEVAFDFTSILPRDSFLIDYEDASAEYAQVPAVGPLVYFRNVTQADPAVRKQMKEYVNDLVANTDALTNPPFDFWLYDYEKWYAENRNVTGTRSFNETLLMFLSLPEFNHHNGNILLDNNTNIIASRVMVELDNMDVRNVSEYMGAFRSLRKVTRLEAVNQNQGEWPFFTFDPIYYLWEFLDVVQHQLLVNTIQGIIAVTLVALFLIPHWSAPLIVLPLTVVLYVDLLGFITQFGVDINGVSYVTLVMSIGLLVDFVMHITLRYFESKEKTRHDKTRDVLHSMGTSILLGGLSTFLGILPLWFASNDIFRTVFIVFLGIVTVGVSHGLIFLPVVLSIIGPQ